MANLHPFAMLNQKKPNPGIPHVSLIQRDLVLENSLDPKPTLSGSIRRRLRPPPRIYLSYAHLRGANLGLTRDARYPIGLVAI